MVVSRPEVLPDELAQVAPRSLDEADQRRFRPIVQASHTLVGISKRAADRVSWPAHALPG